MREKVSKCCMVLISLMNLLPKWNGNGRIGTRLGLYCRSSVVLSCFYGACVTYVILLGLSLGVQSVRETSVGHGELIFKGGNVDLTKVRAGRQWQYATERRELLVYAAYYIKDEFHGRSGEIRVIGAIDSSGGLAGKVRELGVRCLYWLDAGLKQKLMKAIHVNILPDHHNTRYGFSGISTL